LAAQEYNGSIVVIKFQEEENGKGINAFIERYSPLIVNPAPGDLPETHIDGGVFVTRLKNSP